MSQPIREEARFPLAVLMRRLDELAVTLTAEGDQLRYRAPPNALSIVDKQELASRRSEVLRYVRALIATKKPLFETYPRAPIPSVTQRLWWQGIKAAGSQPGDCMRFTLPFSGVHEHTVEMAIRRVIARHDALRYRLIDSGGTLAAAVNAAQEFRVDTLHLAAQSNDPGTMLAAAIAEFESTTIPIEGQWLTLARLMMTGECEGVIAIGINHIVGDATSLMIIRDELSAALRHDADAGTESEALPIQFSQYAAWEASWFQGEVAGALAAYWAHWIAHLPPLRLPRTSVQLFWAPGKCIVYEWGGGSAGAEGVRQLAAGHSATPFVVLLSIFATAMFRWSGQARFGLLSVADGRAYGESMGLESMVGPMVHMDPIEVGMRENTSLPVVLQDIYSSYECARRFRFPLNDSEPGITEREFHQRLAVSINYVALAARPELTRKRRLGQGSEPSQRRATISRGRAGVVRPHDFQALQPVNLRIIHEDDNLYGVLEFNAAVVPEPSQQALVAAFLATLEDALR